MTPIVILEAIKKFLTENVADKILLQKEQVDEYDPSDPIEYVNPYVEIMRLPHKNYTPNDFTIPMILVSFEDGEDGADEAYMNIKLTFATYGGGVYEDSKLPDNKGYVDLLNIIELAKSKLLSAGAIGGKTIIQKPLKYGCYDGDESTWPYWYGYMTFGAKMPVTTINYERD